MALHKSRKGLDLPIAGEPLQAVEAARPCARVALLAADYVGLKPSLAVQPGERVLRGQLLFGDRRMPGVRFVSPASGEVAAIHRGERRALQSVVIEVARDDGPDAQVPIAGLPVRDPAGVDAGALRALLLESGLWSAFRSRPFSAVPASDAVAAALFVTAIDTRPHAPRPEVVLAGREDDFGVGLVAVAKLTSGPTFLCIAPDSPLAALAPASVRVEAFAGPHPAGTAGYHIHRLHPAEIGKPVWHIGYQDVAAIGALLRHGRLDVERVVSLAGPDVSSPRLLRTRLGASTDELTAGELRRGGQRVISGSVLDGRMAQGEVHGYLGRYHQQIAAIPEAGRREFLGWIAPAPDKFSVTGTVLGAFLRGRRFAFDTSANGSPRPMVPIGTYERVMPWDVMPTFLLRALLTGDIEQAEALGVVEFDEEDLALCTYVCPGKIEYGPLLRDMLARIEKEG